MSCDKPDRARRCFEAAGRLDFLNTIATPERIVIDWLCDGQDLVRWLEDARVIDSLTAAKAQTRRRAALDDVAANAREFRDWLRKFAM